MSDIKPSSELLTSIHAADAKGLKGVTTVENPAAKHDMTMVGFYGIFNNVMSHNLFQFGVAKFDKNKLKTVETTEKNVLPTAEDIKQAKEVEKTH